MADDDRPLAGEIQELTDAGWRTAHLGENVSVRDLRRVVVDRGPTFADHPHTDPGDGRTECDRCGKFVWRVTHSCKGIPVTPAAVQRWAERQGGGRDA